MANTADEWVCGDCRSLNAAKQKRCYRCGVLRTAGELTAAAAMTTPAPRESRTVLATAARMGARYRPTWPLATALVPLIVVVTLLQLAGMQVTSQLVGPSGQFIENKATFDRFLQLESWHLGLGLVSVLVWSCWIALVVSNVPAVTASWPPNSPIGAFFAPFIPFVWFWRPYSVVRGVLTLLTDRRAGPQLVALAWWLCVLASYFGPLLVSLSMGARFRTQLEAAVFAGWVRCALLVPAAVLAIGVVTITERSQRMCVQRRETVVLTAGASQPL
jgi:hypothetical protein